MEKKKLPPQDLHSSTSHRRTVPPPIGPIGANGSNHGNNMVIHRMSTSSSHTNSPASHPPPPRISPITYLYCACAALNSVNLGYAIGVSTNAGLYIQKDWQLTDEQLELFLGLLNFCSIFGALLSPVLCDRFGRRRTFGIVASIFIGGAGVTCTARSRHVLFLGRIILGLAVGIGEAIDPMYIAELAPAHVRGALVSWAEAGDALGVVLGFATSLVTDNWRIMMALGATIPAVMLYVSNFVLPESPRWLLRNGQELAARAVLARTILVSTTTTTTTTTTACTGSSTDEDDTTSSNGGGEERREQVNDDETKETIVDGMINEMKQSLEYERASSESVGWEAIFIRPSPSVQRMLLLGVGIAILQQAVGIDSIMFYLMFVIQQSGITDVTHQTIVLILLGVVKLVFVFVGARLFDESGRRPILFTSLVGCAGSLVVLSAAFYIDHPITKVVTIVALGCYLAFFSTGMGPGTWVVVSEIFATSIRAKAMSVSIIPNRITSTIMSSTFLSMAKLLTWPGFFLLLASICLGGAAFLYVYLPETKGRSLESMSLYFAEITGDRSILNLESQAKPLAGSSSGGGIGGTGTYTKVRHESSSSSSVQEEEEDNDDKAWWVELT
jgi:MFS family permease